MDKYIRCPECGKEIKSGAKHCGYCGTLVTYTSDIVSDETLDLGNFIEKTAYICYECGESALPEARFCKKCGGKTGIASERGSFVRIDEVHPETEKERIDSLAGIPGYPKSPYDYGNTPETPPRIKKGFKAAGDL